jgi:hypothetical protein
MAQHDYIIANQSGAAFRADLNNGLAAIVSQNSGTAQPSTTYAYQWWADTATGLLKIRNAANNAWITLRELDGTLLMEDGTAAAPGLSFASDPDSGIFRGGANELGIATNGIERVEFGTTEVVFNDGGANYDFRIEGDTNASLFFVDASAEAVGIGTTSPGHDIDLRKDAAGSTVTLRVRNDNVAADSNSALVLDTPNGVWGVRALRSGSRLAVDIGGSEKAAIDTSGRLLVGTSSWANTSKAVFSGNSSDNLETYVDFNRGTAATAADSFIALLNFRNGGSDTCASIICQTDAACGSGDSPGRLVFSTTADAASDPTERMRINNAGRVLIGTTTDPGYQVTIVGFNSYACLIRQDTGNATYPCLDLLSNFGTGNNVFINFYDSAAARGSITYNRGGGVVAYNTTSDYRAKTLLGDVENTGETIDALKVYRGVMNGATVERPMLVAHEAQEVAPYCVTGEKDAVDDDGNPIYQQMDHQVLVPLLIAEIQQLRARVAALETP